MSTSGFDTIGTAKGADVNRQLAPFALVACLGFLSVGIPLPVLSLFVHDRLDFNALIVGFVVGAQSFATLVSRRYAGRMCDSRGPKPTTLAGLAAASVSGLCYLASCQAIGSPVLALAILLLGRIVLGVGESLFITATAAWSVARVGSAHAGRAMAWSGISMYSALAIGAPIGTQVYRSLDFNAVAYCAIAMPLVAIAVAALLRPLTVEPQPHISYLQLLGRMWPPGLGMALASAGVGTISAFLPLYYNRHGWSGVGAALMAFGSAYILMRLIFGGLPDRIGGFNVAMASIATETLGLVTIWLAPTPGIGLAGATLTGLGYSLIFPALGIEALRRASTQNRGLALGVYLACFDLGIAMAGPVAGLIAQAFGLETVFPAAAGAAILAFVLTASTRTTSKPAMKQKSA
jgi:MFS family permease